MLMRYFDSLNYMLQQYEDLLLKNHQNTKSFDSVLKQCMVVWVSFMHADNLSYAVQMLLILAYCGYLC